MLNVYIQSACKNHLLERKWERSGGSPETAFFEMVQHSLLAFFKPRICWIYQSCPFQGLAVFKDNEFSSTQAWGKCRWKNLCFRRNHRDVFKWFYSKFLSRWMHQNHLRRDGPWGKHTIFFFFLEIPSTLLEVKWNLTSSKNNLDGEKVPKTWLELECVFCWWWLGFVEHELLLMFLFLYIYFSSVKGGTMFFLS